MAVLVVTEGAFTFETPKVLFTAPISQLALIDGPAFPYDVAADGQRFLVAQSGGADPVAPIHVVTNWTEELTRLAPRD